MPVSLVPPFSCCRVLVHVDFRLPHFSLFEPIASDEMFEAVVRVLDRIVGWCVAVPVDDVRNATNLPHMTHWRSTASFCTTCVVSKLQCISFSFFFVDFVALFSTGSFIMYSLCQFAILANASNVTRFIDMVFWIPSSSLVTIVKETSTTINDLSSLESACCTT